MVLPDQFVLVSPTEVGGAPDFELMTALLRDMLEALMLDDGGGRFPFVFQVWGQLPSPRDVMSYSRTSVPRRSLDDERPAGNVVLGAGIRVFLQGDEGSVWELKVEPFLRDFRRIHVEAVCSHQPTAARDIIPRMQALWGRWEKWVKWGVSHFFEGLEVDANR